MKKFLFILLTLVLTALSGFATELSVTLADLGLESETYTDGKTIDLNDDIQLVVSGGNAAPKFTGTYMQVAPNGNVYVQGKTEDVNITKVVFSITTKSNQFYPNMTDCNVGGFITFDEDNKLSTWEYAEGSNLIEIKCGGQVRFTAIAVTYTTGDDNGTGDNSGTVKEAVIVMGDQGLSSNDNLVEKSPFTLNEDIQLNFGVSPITNVAPTYRLANSVGYAAMVINNTTLELKGLSEDIKITEVIFSVRSASYQVYPKMVTSEPEGTIEYDTSDVDDPYRNIWTTENPASSVVFSFDTGSYIKKITVKYTGGKAAGSETPGPDDPDDPEEPSDDNLLSTGFDTTAEFSQFTVINMQEGSNTWKHSTGNPYAKIENDLGNTIPKDDYLVSPALELKAGCSYRLTFDTWCGTPDYPEIVAAYLLKDATNVTDKTTIIANTDVTADRNMPMELTGFFTPEVDGTYYVAVHAASKPGMHYLYVDNIETSRGVSSLSPGMVTDFVCAASATGENEVMLTFKAPTLCEDGVTALEGVKSVIISRDGVQVAELEATAGQELSYTDKPESTGTHRYNVTVSAASGKSYDAKATVYVGMARPLAPTSLTAVETSDGVVELTWEPVTTNIYGGSVDESMVTYNIYAGPYTKYKEGVTGSTATIEYVAEGEHQKIVTFMIKAVTSAGESNEFASAGTMAVGKPYAMPYSEGFADSHVSYDQPFEIVEDAKYVSVLWRCFEEYSTDNIKPVTFDRGMIVFVSNYAGTESTMRTGKIQIDADAVNPYLSFFYYVLPGSSNYFSLYVNDDKIDDIYTDGDVPEWREVLVPLSEYKGQVVRVAFTGYSVVAGDPIAIDNIKVQNERNNDLSISRARIPYEMHLGKEHACEIKVTNLGVNMADAYTVTVKADGEPVETFSGSNLERGATDVFAFNAVPAVCPGETIHYTVELNAADDENAEDNLVEVEVNVPEYNMPAPSGISLDGMVLTWNEFVKDDFVAHTVTESFEAYDEFKINEAGDWTFVDADAYPTFGIEDGYQSWPGMYEPMAFMVFNNYDNSFVGMGTMTFDAYDGGQFMASMAIDCRNLVEINNEDYMISPELSGKAQTVSFYARSTSMVFRESFQVLYSTSDDPTDVKSFRVLDTYDEIDPTWTEYTAELPAGTKYFAICNVSLNKYMLFVDSVTFEAAGKEEAVAGYNVYAAETSDAAEWTKLNDGLLAEPQFEFTEVSDNKYVRVHALFENGIETVSEPYDISLLGIGSVIYDRDGKAEYYNLNGVRLSGRPSQPGMYIVRDGNGTHKVMINR